MAPYLVLTHPDLVHHQMPSNAQLKALESDMAFSPPSNVPQALERDARAARSSRGVQEEPMAPISDPGHNSSPGLLSSDTPMNVDSPPRACDHTGRVDTPPGFPAHPRFATLANTEGTTGYQQGEESSTPHPSTI